MFSILCKEHCMEDVEGDDLIYMDNFFHKKYEVRL